MPSSVGVSPMAVGAPSPRACPTRLLCFLPLQRDYYYSKDGIVAYSGDAINATKSIRCECVCDINPPGVIRVVPPLV